MCDKESDNQQTFLSIRSRLQRHLSASDNVSQLSVKFGALNSNSKRVNFVLDLLESFDIHVELQSDDKSNEVALRMREQGNEMFKVKKMKEAWELYNKSLCYAKGENLGLAYANRSAVLFEMDLHEQCLMDIKRALHHDYPEHLKTKLFVREKNCKNLDNEDFTEPHRPLPEIISPHPEIQSASDCLEMRSDEGFGRYVVAKRDIKAGEVLAVEKPFVSLLVKEYYSHCHECVKLCYNLMPCPNCSQAMYCGESCRAKAYETYHKYECSILRTLRGLEFDKLKLIALKIALCVEGEYEKIEEFSHNSVNLYRSDRYREIHNLVTNVEKRSVSDLFERATVSACIYTLVKNHTNFFQEKNEKYNDVFKEILLLHMQTGPSNFHEITELVPNSSYIYEPHEIACGCFSFLSLLNHSCSPNVTRFCYGSTIVLRAIQNISKGDQCFDNYGYHHALMDKSYRQKQLQNQYYFQCSCEACENNWPLYKDLSAFKESDIDEGIIDSLAAGDAEGAESYQQDVLETLERLQAQQPCRNFCQVLEVLKQCFAVLGNKRSLF